ncbi:response regulator transcription factor [Neptunicella marina]|uniref:Response regulator transcription factor n=1 Tax=Neptunicella marina TaxID=2125989 RepID=A0A8J6IYH6_9ALTE|nr:response regulator transcription factor [Neptunicella marina]MBC3767567.1 response regulator transcription factor [Neptunicella marina]
MNKHNKLSILLVEDNQRIAESVIQHFTQKGHVVDYASSAETALNLLEQSRFDLMILDLMLPGMDGLTFCKQAREQNNYVIPVLMLTAKDAIDDIVQGFNHGADDYLTKPFAMQELEVRVVALSRRHMLNTQYLIELGELQIDRRALTVKRQGRIVECSRMGYNILKYLAEAYPRVVTRSELIQTLWGDNETESDALRTHMYQLRLCLDKPFTSPMLKTVHSVGFTLQNIE